MISTLSVRLMISPWRNTCRARMKSFAPMKWAACTENPSDMALVMLLKSQVVDSTRPMLAEASAPKCPTMEASMKNIITLVICASIDGILNSTIKLSFSLVLRACPSRILASNLSVVFLPNIPCRYLLIHAQVRKSRRNL